MNPKIKSQVREWTESFIIAIVLALLIRTFVVQAFKIPSGSMIPTFKVGDRIFVNKFIYGARIPFTEIRLPAMRDPRRGDIVVFVSPEDKKKDFVKRLIAIGGETVEIRDGRIYIDGKDIQEPLSIRSVYYYNAGDFGKEGVSVKVPEDSYFVLGDNSASSRDSRYWGFVSRKSLLGNAICIYWPLHRMRVIKN
ncbi:MAG: signal peptidase I [Candidatus Omnitrophica bacterium]|nr:signal peptidase I [Candidatus Omnitrophota bacterium]